MKRSTTNYKVSEQTAAILDLKSDLQDIASRYEELSNSERAKLQKVHGAIGEIDDLVNELLVESIHLNICTTENRGELI